MAHPSNAMGVVTELCERRDELSRTAKATLVRARAQIAVKPTDEKGAKERARLLERLPEFVEAAEYDWGTKSLDRVRGIVSKKLGKGHSPGVIKRSCKLVEDAGGETRRLKVTWLFYASAAKATTTTKSNCSRAS